MCRWTALESLSHLLDRSTMIPVRVSLVEANSQLLPHRANNVLSDCEDWEAQPPMAGAATEDGSINARYHQTKLVVLRHNYALLCRSVIISAGMYSAGNAPKAISSRSLSIISNDNNILLIQTVTFASKAQSDSSRPTSPSRAPPL